MLNSSNIGRFFLIVFFISFFVSLTEFIMTVTYMLIKSSGSENLHIMADNIWNFLGMLCHQMPERSIFIDKYQLPVCNRCTFALLGKISFVLLYLNKGFRNWISKNAFFIFLIVLPPLLLEAVLKIFFYYASGITIRTVNGFLQGIFISFFLLSLYEYFSKINSLSNIFVELKKLRNHS